jgi:hypothetical protein
MPKTIRASQKGLDEIIDPARKRRGWAKNSPAWQQAAYVSESTLKRFWLVRNKPILEDNFVNICKAVGVDNWQAVAETEPEVVVPRATTLDLALMPAVPHFYGQIKEQQQLHRWIQAEGMRLVAIWGMAGVGKSALMATVLEQVLDRQEAGPREESKPFDAMIWRSLQGAPHPTQLVMSLIGWLSPEPVTQFPESFYDQMTLLIHLLQHQRVLLVLDGWDQVLGNNMGGQCRRGYEEYGKLLKRLGSELHRSCVVLTSPEKLEAVSLLESQTAPVRSLKLDGLKEGAVQLLSAKQLVYEPNDWMELNHIYRGNPLFLNMVATMVQELYGGKVSKFLRDNTILGSMFDHLLDERFQHLSELEKSLLKTLATSPEPLSIDQIRLQLEQSGISEAVWSLEKRSLLEKNIEEGEELYYTLQPVMLKYVQKYL